MGIFTNVAVMASLGLSLLVCGSSTCAAQSDAGETIAQPRVRTQAEREGLEPVAADPTLASDKRIYVSIMGGATYADDLTFHSTILGQPVTTDVEFETGYTFGAAVGSYFGPLRLEGEISYRSNDFDNHYDFGALGSTTIDAELSATSLMGNLFFDLTLFRNFDLYVGGGAGVAWTDLDWEFLGRSFSEGTTEFAYQGMAGAAVHVSPRLAVTLGYRIWSTDELDDDVYIHSAELGLRVEL